MHVSMLVDVFRYSESLDLPVKAHHLPTVLLLGGVRKDLEHGVAGRIYSETGLLREAKVGGTRLAQVSEDHSWVHGEGIEPGVFAVDTNDVPVYRRLGGPVAAIWNWRLVSS